MADDSKTKWTPGPWRVERYSEDGRLYIATAGETIAMIEPDWLDCKDETEANARVLAAAPKMAAALKAMLSDSYFADATSSYCEICERHAPKDEEGFIVGPVKHKDDCSYGMARAALSLATGKEG